MKKPARSHWERALLVCGKCSKKLDGGYGKKGRTSLAKALRAEPGVGKGRKARIGVAEVKCLGLCPKRGVTLVDSAEPSRWRVVPAGASAADLLRSLPPVGAEPKVELEVAVIELVEQIEPAPATRL